MFLERAVHALPRLAGCSLAFAGVALIGLSHLAEAATATCSGVALCLVSALVYSISLVLQKPLVGAAAGGPGDLAGLHRRRGGLPAVRRATWCARRAAAPTSSVLWVVYLGVFPTAIAFTTYAYALRHMTAGRLGVTTYLVPPITIVMGLVFLGEAPPTLAYVGGALALVGVAVARHTPRVPADEPALGA